MAFSQYFNLYLGRAVLIVKFICKNYCLVFPVADESKVLFILKIKIGARRWGDIFDPVVKLIVPTYIRLIYVRIYTKKSNQINY